MKEKIVDHICKLIEVKSIVTLSLIIISCYGFVVGKISAELFASWVAAVITYFFTKKSEQK